MPNLPIVDLFSNGCVLQKYEQRTHEERTEMLKDPKHLSVAEIIKGKPTEKIVLENHLQSTLYMAEKLYDENLTPFIVDMLDRSAEYKQWRQRMPSKTPKELSNYKNRYPKYNANQLDDEINKINCQLSEGQTLIHGGLWSNFSNSGDTALTKRPLSTSFCPQVALRNAEHKNKAYDSNRIDLMVLTVKNPSTSVFVFRHKGAKLGHELEVLFASGAKLQKTAEHCVGTISAGKMSDNGSMLEKDIPIYVLEIDIS